MANRNQYTYTPQYSSGDGRAYSRGEETDRSRPRQSQGTASGSAYNAPRQSRPRVQYEPRERREERPLYPLEERAPARTKAPAPQRTVPQRTVHRAEPAPEGKPTKDLIMFAMILFVIPLLGIVSAFVAPLRWVFIVVAAVSMIALWLGKCFVAGTRKIISVVLMGASVLSLVAVLDTTPKNDNYPSVEPPSVLMSDATQGMGGESDAGTPASIDPGSGEQQGSVQSNSLAYMGFPSTEATPTPPIEAAGGAVAADTAAQAQAGAVDFQSYTSMQSQQATAQDAQGMVASAGDAAMDAAAGALGEQPPSANAAVSAAQAALEAYLRGWQVQDYEEMLKYTTPSWRNIQKAPQQQLYWNHNWWLLDSWTLTSETTSQTADSATFKMIADLRKANSAKTAVRQEYSALVFQENGEWFVDPDSLRNGLPVAEATIPPDAAANAEGGVADVQADPTVNPKTQLYYNGSGGKFYHVNDKCSSIDEKYYAAMKPFTYDELDSAPYSKLTPCAVCDAPRKEQ